MEIVSKIRCYTILLVFLGFLARHMASAWRVLLVPPASVGISHWMAVANVGRALVDRGHAVDVVVSEDTVEQRRAEWPDFQFKTFKDQGTQAALKAQQDQAYSAAEEMSPYKLTEIFASTSEKSKIYCSLMLGGSNLVGRLRASQYSAVISDPFLPCGAILSAHLDFRVPHIAVMRGDPNYLDEKATGVPLPLSYVPFLGTNFTDDMSFIQRLQNVVLSTLFPMKARWDVSSKYDELVRTYVSENETIQSVTSRTDLWLYRTDNVLDFPRPSMPNMVQVGGLNIRAVNPLTEDMEAFVQSAGDDGVIVVSFGSMVKTMSTERRDVLAAAFARLRQKVVWRYVGEKPTGLGNNTKVMNWLPQNDLLGHRKTRVFVTHAGYNGLCEAMYHGVPVVCLPLYGDQPANAARVVARGLGVKLDFNTVTADQLYQAVIHVLTNNSFQETAARLSRLYRDQPQPPMERAVWWIEHVIKNGRLPHLRARAVDLPWYQYYLLDVAAFLLAVCTAVLGAVLCSCSFMYGVFWHFCRIFSAKIKCQ